MRLWVAGILMVAAVGLWIALDVRRSEKQAVSGTGDTGGMMLPVLGSVITPLPDGDGKAIAERACLACHSGDMLRQQRLTEKQWTAELTKMTGWGAVVPEDQKAALIAYFVEHFGPDNDRFQPVVAQPPPR